MTVAEFADRIGLTNTCSIYGGNNYKRFEPYITKNEGEKAFVSQDNYFAYVKKQEEKFEVIAKCGLFTEYLNKELGVTYKDMSNFIAPYTKNTSGALLVGISSLRFGYEMAIAIMYAYSQYDREKMESFSKYYGWGKI